MQLITPLSKCLLDDAVISHWLPCAHCPCVALVLGLAEQCIRALVMCYWIWGARRAGMPCVLRCRYRGLVDGN